MFTKTKLLNIAKHCLVNTLPDDRAGVRECVTHTVRLAPVGVTRFGRHSSGCETH